MTAPLRSLCLCLAMSIAAASEEGPWIELFDGRSLDGWTTVKGKPVTRGWTVEDGAIFRAGRGGDIITERKFGDFILEFEWKISEGGNSGVKYRVQGSVGLEYQVLDDDKHPDRRKPSHRAAAFYDLLAPAEDKPLKPVGEWNHGRIVARGPKLEHWLNGRLVAGLDQSGEDWAKRFKASKYRRVKDFGVKPSAILLQDHGDAAWFRNLRIKPL